jgi:hypothetical protein
MLHAEMWLKHATVVLAGMSTANCDPNGRQSLAAAAHVNSPATPSVGQSLVRTATMRRSRRIMHRQARVTSGG